jgi:S1-C subfamily serine protease
MLGRLLFLDAASQQQPAEAKRPLSPEARAQIRAATAAVGLIFVRNATDPAGPPRPRASAVLVRKDGILATNYHVIVQDKSDRLYDEITFSLPPSDGSSGNPAKRFRAVPVAMNKAYDLALLRIVADGAGQLLAGVSNLPAIELADTRNLRLLDDLMIIGFPGLVGSTVMVNPGMIEGIDRLEQWIKTDARLLRGNSGGAAVNSEGKLIGIPTKVIVDSQVIDKDGDGFPDEIRQFGAVGFLRPAHLVGAMLAQLAAEEQKVSPAESAGKPLAAGKSLTGPEPAPLVAVRGTIQSAATGKPVAGARVGLLPLGSQAVSADTLLTWGGTNAEGLFELNKRVPPGRYTLKAAAFGYGAFTEDVDIRQNAAGLVIQLQPST